MKNIFIILLTGLILLSCKDTMDGSGSSETSNSDIDSGTVTISLSGIPFSIENLKIINLRISEIRADIGTEEEEWISLISYDPGMDINILEYLGENAFTLAEEILLPAGQINQIRLLLDAPEEGEDDETNACYLFYDDGEGNTSTEPLVIPSGSSSGLKAVGIITVPRNGNVDVYATFDARRFVILGDGSIKMKPVLWIIAENEAGTITGSINPLEEILSYPDLSIFAYESGSYDSSQLDEDINGLQFPDAVYNCFVDTADGSFTLPYLAPGSYDLVLAYTVADSFVELQVEEGIELESGTNYDFNITLSVP